MIKYTGTEKSNGEMHNGGLPAVAGVNSFQVLRANRHEGKLGDDTQGWTYNHAPMLAWWKGKLYLEYLSNPVEEHCPPGRTLLTCSSNGYDWEKPKIVFPSITLHQKEKEIPCVMHQRMGFYKTAQDRLLVLGFYGYSPDHKIVPFDRYGVGRVIREVYENGELGPIYFIHVNTQAGWNMDTLKQQTGFAFYTEAKEEGFLQGVESLLADRLFTQQWAEEHGDSDPKVTVKGGPKAFSWYTLPDGRTAGFWKWRKAGISEDKGKSWNLFNTPTFLCAGGKIWSQRTSDQRYALVYNPTPDNKHRWPLAIVTSEDGLNFDHLKTVADECPAMRYWGGGFKDWGQNYVRGVSEGNGTAPDGSMWIAYSMNKEDIWVSCIPVPVESPLPSKINDDFNRYPVGKRIAQWNTYSSQWAFAAVQEKESGQKCMVLTDSDPCDYAKAERIFAPCIRMEAKMNVLIKPDASEPLYIEMADTRGIRGLSIYFSGDGKLYIHHGRRESPVADYKPGCWYEVTIRGDIESGTFDVLLDGKSLSGGQEYQGQSFQIGGYYFYNNIRDFSRLTLRTGAPHQAPTLYMQAVGTKDMEGSEIRKAPSEFFIKSVSVQTL